MFRSKSIPKKLDANVNIKDLERVNRMIDQGLRKDEEAERSMIKLLLLGASECGKSTVLKQMRILHDNGFKDEEYEIQKHIIHDNILDAMLTLIDATSTYNISYENKSNLENAEVVQSAGSRRTAGGRPTTTLQEDVVEAIKQLWRDAGIKQCLDKAAEIQLHDSTQYFMEHIDRVCATGYKPNEQDMLRSRVATMGIIETRFKLKGMTFRVFDVGGQRSQRRKWIHCFDNVTAVIFIVAVSEYDQMLREDPSMNRVHEARLLFDSIVNCMYFKEKNFILFLNKRDLFAEKIARNIPITKAFPNFKGLHNYETCINYIADKFEAVNSTPDTRMIYTHQTCGTDTDQVQVVLDSCLDTIAEARLKAAGILA